MRAIVLFGAIALGATHAAAQKAERPEVKAGDRWQFVEWYTVPSATPNRTWIVTSVTAAGIEGTENGEPLRLTRDLTTIDSPRETNSNPGSLRFPLEVGKTWSYSNDYLFKPKSSRGHMEADVTVVGHERVKVPAGEFDAFKLTARERISGTSPIGSRIDAETVRTYWYAPAARTIVKRESKNPYLGPSTVELVAFELQP
jgi:hypothetical protein